MTELTKQLQGAIALLEARQAELAAAASAEVSEAEALEQVHTVLAANHAFDAEDCRVLSDTAQRHRARAQELLSQSAQRTEELRQQRETLLSLYQIAEARRTCLEEVDASLGVLRRHPILLEFMASKQATLEQLLVQRLEELSESAHGAAVAQGARTEG